MKTVLPVLPVLLLCAGPAFAVDPNDLPDGWWAPTVSDCKDPTSAKRFEIRLKAQPSPYLESADNHCTIAKVSDTAIGYRLALQCDPSPDQKKVEDTSSYSRQIVVDAIGPVTMRADGRRVYRCSPLTPGSPAEISQETSTPSPATVTLPKVPTRLSSLPGNPEISEQQIAGPSKQATASSSASIVERAVARGQIVTYAGQEVAGTIVVRTKERALYLVQGNGTAIRYRVAVGKPGAAWSGIERVTAKQEWPAWTPTPSMRRRKPGLPSHVPGGSRSPLGARALYLGSTAYRIHGTTDPDSIGRAASSGCIRMLNQDVIELYERVPVGTRVEVM